MFLVLTLVIPLIMLAAGFIGYITEHLLEDDQVHLSVLDKTGVFLPYLQEQEKDPYSDYTLKAAPYHGQTDIKSYREEIEKEDVDALLVVDKESLEKGNLSLYIEGTRSITPHRIENKIENAINKAATSYRIDQMGLEAGQIRQVTAPVKLEKQQITGEDWDLADFIAPVIAGSALIISVILSGQILMYGVIKEKRNRVVEILLSSISSLELLLGKMAGFGALSLAQVSIWLGTGLFAAYTFLEIPEMNLTASHLVPPVLFFFFGYLMFFSIFTALGATMKEAEGGSQAQGLIIVIPVLPLMFSGPLLQAPETTWVKIISHVPFFTPTTVLLRMGVSTLPFWEIATTLSVLILSTALFIYLGSRIFEGTILQYERSAGLKDLKALFVKK